AVPATSGSGKVFGPLQTDSGRELQRTSPRQENTMSRPLLAGLMLVLIASAAQANPPSNPAAAGHAQAEATSATPPRDPAVEPASPNSKPVPLAQANKPDEHKLSKLKVYPCF
ncbi:MAG: hypothetical protein AABY62_03360, partial [Pseudomonadota bacterium]